MPRLIGCLMVLCGSLAIVMPDAFAQPEMTPQVTIRGDLLSIKGDAYLIKDMFGRNVYLRVDKNTQRERMLVPGRKSKLISLQIRKFSPCGSASRPIMKGRVQ